jgi:hypothetical protein
LKILVRLLTDSRPQQNLCWELGLANKLASCPLLPGDLQTSNNLLLPLIALFKKLSGIKKNERKTHLFILRMRIAVQNL